MIHRSLAYKSYKQIIDHIWSSISYELYTTNTPYSHLGFVDQGGLSSYYSPYVTKAEAEMISEFLQSISLSSINTKLFKLNDTSFEIRIASVYTNSNITGSHKYRD